MDFVIIFGFGMLAGVGAYLLVKRLIAQVKTDMDSGEL